MSEMHPFADRWNDYLDGELEESERRRIDAHLAGCEECRRALDELEAVSRAAKELRPVEPPERIWQAVAEGLKSRGLSPRPAPRSFGSGALAPVLALAAAVLLAIGLWAMLRPAETPPGSASSPEDPEALASMVTEELKSAEAHYARAIEGLERIMAQNEGVLSPELSSVLNQNLDLIESAIAESRQAINSEPESLAAQESLLLALRRKVTLLSNTILLINEIRKGEGENALDLIDEMRKTTTPQNPI